MEKVKISVIIPTCDRLDLLDRAIKSVINQTFTDLEVIIVDDGKKTSAENLVKSIADNRIRYFKNQKSGAPSARNFGVSMACAELISFLDDDDEYLPNKLQKEVDIMNKFGNEIGFVFCEVYNNYVQENFKERSVIKEFGKNNFFDLIILHKIRILTPTILIKKEVFNAVGGFDEDLVSNQEWDLMIRVGKKYIGYCLNEPLVNVYIDNSREHVGGNLSRRIAGRLAIINKHIILLKNNPKILAIHYFYIAIFYKRDKKTLQFIFYLFKYFYFMCINLLRKIIVKNNFS